MMKFVVVMFFTLLAAVTFCCNGAAPPPPATPRASAYLLALQWPPTVCATERCKSGLKDIPTAFKLHGLWPTQPNWGASLSGCSGPEFSGTQVNRIQQINYYWPSYLKGDTPFWKSEWETHGLCSGLSLEDYFTQAIGLTKGKANPILAALRSSSITPGARRNARVP